MWLAILFVRIIKIGKSTTIIAEKFSWKKSGRVNKSELQKLIFAKGIGNEFAKKESS
jgi:hypothetical protein